MTKNILIFFLSISLSYCSSNTRDGSDEFNDETGQTTSASTTGSQSSGTPGATTGSGTGTAPGTGKHEEGPKTKKEDLVEKALPKFKVCLIKCNELIDCCPKTIISQGKSKCANFTKSLSCDSGACRPKKCSDDNSCSQINYSKYEKGFSCQPDGICKAKCSSNLDCCPSDVKKNPHGDCSTFTKQYGCYNGLCEIKKCKTDLECTQRNSQIP